MSSKKYGILRLKIPLKYTHIFEPQKPCVTKGCYQYQSFFAAKRD